jgi:hypothetical protein
VPRRLASGSSVFALEQCGAFCLGLGAVASSLLAITGGLFAIGGGAHSTLGRLDTLSSGTLPVLFRAQNDLPVRPVVPVSLQGSSIAQHGRPIACHRREISVACDYITSSSRRETRLRCLLALVGAAVAKTARDVEHGRVAALGEHVIAGCLIALGRSLIAIGGGLVAVGSRLVSIRQGLILIGTRLLVPARDRIGEETALLLCLEYAVRRSRRMIVWRLVGHDGPPSWRSDDLGESALLL